MSGGLGCATESPLLSSPDMGCPHSHAGEEGGDDMSIFCYQHHINDWRTKTAGLSLEEKGAYREMMDWFYALEGKLPADQDALCRILGVQTQSERNALAVITEKFWLVTEGGFLTQKRAAEELTKIKIRSEKAQKSARSRYNKDLDSANAERTQSERTANQEPITNNQEPYIDSPLPPTREDEDQAVNLFNETAARMGIPKVQKLSETRRKHLRARLREVGGLEGWVAALEKLEAIPAMRGENDRCWKADFDFLVTESRFVKLMEGKYDYWGRKQSRTERTAQQLKDWVES